MTLRKFTINVKKIFENKTGILHETKSVNRYDMVLFKIGLIGLLLARHLCKFFQLHQCHWNHTIHMFLKNGRLLS